MSVQVVCVVCPLGCPVEVDGDRVSGHGCRKGVEYARREATNPVRLFTGSVRVRGGDWAMLSVRSSSGVPKARLREIAGLARRTAVDAPVRPGQVVLADVLGTGVDLVATRAVARAPS